MVWDSTERGSTPVTPPPPPHQSWRGNCERLDSLPASAAWVLLGGLVGVTVLGPAANNKCTMSELESLEQLRPDLTFESTS